MKAVKLCYDDPDIFQTSVTSDRCDFVRGRFEAFMQMYKTQGSTFWLRFLISFKNHVEEKFCCNKKWLAFLMSHYQFIKVLNFIYISLHKKFIESSNTAVKKFIHNLIDLALNSPSYLNFTCQQWLIYIKSCKQLYNIFQNLFKVSEPIEFNGFTAFVFTVYTDFYCALCAVFEQWCKAKDLTDEEFKKLDSKVIYWLPTFDTERKIKPFCFEKYISDYWKENLQRMLMTDNIHDLFSIHKIAGCCEKFEKEKNIFKVFQFTDRHTIELMKILNNESELDDSSDEESVHTITEVCMKDICILKPQAALCSISSHKKCFVKICHAETCLEPFVCQGDEPCTLICEKADKKKEKKKQEKFWKAITADIFPIDKKKRDVSTLAESYNRDIQTYLHTSEFYELNVPLSVLKHTYHQCLAELHNFDLNPRRTECLNRLRKKLSQKNPSNTFQFNVSALRQPFYRDSLYDNAVMKMMKFEDQYCISKGHNLKKCEGKCFKQAANTVASSTSSAFGRVILLSKTFITIPCELTCKDKKVNVNISDKPLNLNNNDNKITSNKQSEPMKNIKKNTSSSLDNIAKNSTNKESADDVPASEELKDEIEENPAKDISDDDDDIDEILKLIGIGEPDKNLAVHEEEINDVTSSEGTVKILPKDDEAVENFFNLIGLTEEKLNQDRTFNHFQEESSETLSLKICAFCKKSETRKKMFKKCSRCKEENFPVQHYYCSRECLLEDWAETHEEEHLRFNKEAIKNK